MPATVSYAQALDLPEDIDVLDTGAATAALRCLKTVRGYLDAYEARLTTRLQHLATAGRSAPAVDVATRAGSITTSEARRRERRADALAQAPALAARLAHGEVSAAHADVFAQTAWRLDDATRAAFSARHDELAADAAAMTPEQFARRCRQVLRRVERDGGIQRDQRQRRDTRLTKTIDIDGMYVLNAHLHPELGQIVFGAIDTETGRLVTENGDRGADRHHLAAHALGRLLTGAHQARRPHEAELLVLIDAATLTDPDPQVHAGTCEYDDGTPLPPSTARRLACNGRLTPLVLDERGVVLNAGRAQRLANRDQRKALRAMYPTCVFPGCDIPFRRCEIHHLTPFGQDGQSNLADLRPACSHHHHTLHLPGWTLHVQADHSLTITTPDGQTLTTDPTSRPPPDDTASHLVPPRAWDSGARPARSA